MQLCTCRSVWDCRLTMQDLGSVSSEHEPW